MEKIKYRIKHNDALSVYPVSLFVEIIDIMNEVDVFNAWIYISEQHLGDIIIHGEVQNNKDALNMLSARLLFSGFNVSIIISELHQTSFVDVMAKNLIVFFKSNVQNSTHFKKNIELLKTLGVEDTIIIVPKSMKELVFITNYLISKEIKARVMVFVPSGDITSSLLLLDNNLYHIFPYYGKIY